MFSSLFNEKSELVAHAWERIKNIFWLFNYDSFRNWGLAYFSKEEEKYIFHFEILKLSKMENTTIKLNVISKDQLNDIVRTLKGIKTRSEQIDCSNNNPEIFYVLHDLHDIKEQLFKTKFPDGNIQKLEILLRELKVKDIHIKYIDEKWKQISNWRNASKGKFIVNNKNNEEVKSIIKCWNSEWNHKDKKIILMKIIDEFKYL